MDLLMVDGQVARLRQRSAPLPGGLTGWFQRGLTDCLQACTATVTGLPYEECAVSSLRDLHVWAEGRGLVVRGHFDGPPSGLWIGFAPVEADGYRHTVVGLGGVVYHDPASGWEFTNGQAPETRHIEWAVSLEAAC